MSVAVAKLPDSSKTRACKPGELFVLGKIHSITKFQLKNKEHRYNNRITMKDMTDDYAFPMAVDVISVAPLGPAGDFWEGVVTIKTYRADWETKPDEDGVIKKIKEIKLNCYFTE